MATVGVKGLTSRRSLLELEASVFFVVSAERSVVDSCLSQEGESVESLNQNEDRHVVKLKF